MTAEPKHEERAHATLGASGAYRWMACPGSIRISEGLPNESTIYAAQGTAAHELAELVLTDEQQLSAHDMIGRRITVGNHVFEVDEDMAEAVQLYVDTVHGDMLPGDLLAIEKQFSLEDLRQGLWGTNDALRYSPSTKTLTVYDYKHGAGHVVDVEENPQLLYYGLGAARESGWAVETVELVIVQPRAHHKDGVVRRWRTDALMLLGWASDLLDAAARTDDPNAPRNPGSWCKFCIAAGICPELRQQALDAAQAEFAEAPTDLTNDELAAILTRSELVSDWVSAVGSEAMRRAARGEHLPGFKLVEKQARRKWALEDETLLAELIQQQFSVPADELFTSKLKSPAQLEKLIPKSDRPQLADFVERKSSGLTLARSSDRRPEVLPMPGGEEFSVSNED